MNRGILYALGAAALFGASTPFAKLLLGQVSPLVLAAKPSFRPPDSR